MFTLFSLLTCSGVLPPSWYLLSKSFFYRAHLLPFSISCPLPFFTLSLTSVTFPPFTFLPGVGDQPSLRPRRRALAATGVGVHLVRPRRRRPGRVRGAVGGRVRGVPPRGWHHLLREPGPGRFPGAAQVFVSTSSCSGFVLL